MFQGREKPRLQLVRLDQRIQRREQRLYRLYLQLLDILGQVVVELDRQKIPRCTPDQEMVDTEGKEEGMVAGNHLEDSPSVSCMDEGDTPVGVVLLLLLHDQLLEMGSAVDRTFLRRLFLDPVSGMDWDK